MCIIIICYIIATCYIVIFSCIFTRIADYGHWTNRIVNSVRLREMFIKSLFQSSQLPEDLLEKVVSSSYSLEEKILGQSHRNSFRTQVLKSFKLVSWSISFQSLLTNSNLKKKQLSVKISWVKDSAVIQWKQRKKIMFIMTFEQWREFKCRLFRLLL